MIPKKILAQNWNVSTELMISYLSLICNYMNTTTHFFPSALV